ncbi:MAG: T9SS type A sorting domain-containing protein, partial [Rhodothermia bacterium]|nr:T9SS type A sorting domain-containing protein [Rhodothermia bacterium]
VSREPSHVLYVGASGRGCCEEPTVYRIENADSLFSEPVASTLPVAPGSYLHGIAVNPLDADELLVVFSNYGVQSVFHSLDGGATFDAVQGNLADSGLLRGPSVRSAAILPDGKRTIYLIASSTGLYASTTLSGNSTEWQPQGESVLGRIIVEALASRVSDGRVVAGTHGRGLFVGSPLPVVGSERVPAPTAVSLLQNYPNPVTEHTTINFRLSSRAQVSLTLYDVAGRLVETLLDGATLGPGQHRINVSAEGLASGSYVYQMQVREGGRIVAVESKQMTIVR